MQVFAPVHKTQRDIFPLTTGEAAGFTVRLQSGAYATLRSPYQFAGYLAGPDGALTSIRAAAVRALRPVHSRPASAAAADTRVRGQPGLACGDSDRPHQVCVKGGGRGLGAWGTRWG